MVIPYIDVDIHFIITLFAYFYAGIIAVPAYLPNRIRSRVDIASRRLQSIIENATPRILLTTEKYLSFLPNQLGIIATDRLGFISRSSN